MNSDRMRTVAETAFVIFIFAALFCVLFTMAEDIERLKRVTTPRLVTGMEKGPADLAAGPLEPAEAVQIELDLPA